MKNLLKNKLAVIIILILLVIILLLAANQVLFLRRAHSSFANYYAFRGCAQLLATTTDSGTCRTDSGQIIKIVKWNGRWYLDGNLPTCWLGVCL